MTDIHPSARRHGVRDDNIRHAIAHHLYRDEIAEDPLRALYLGPDPAGNLLEIIAIVRPGLTELAIHAMVMRAKYQPLLEGRKRS